MVNKYKKYVRDAEFTAKPDGNRNNSEPYSAKCFILSIENRTCLLVEFVYKEFRLGGQCQTTVSCCSCS